MTEAPTQSSKVLEPETRSILKIVFLTLFLDLVGFSIIFPLYPSMLKYYLALEGTDGFLGEVIAALTRFQTWTGPAGDVGIVVLFGGVLGSLYSLLQFACAPLIGGLSDRYGRKPVLLVCVSGIALSYALWFFAGSFAVLLLARFIGGVAGGNISTATAVVADITGPRERSKGMALIGMAFGLGFIMGPVLGGITSSINLTVLQPTWSAFGVNPFSTPALIAFVISIANLILIAWALPETHPDATSGSGFTRRPINPLTLFHVESYPGVSRTNMAYFLFLMAFSGMEFSLTFLATERFGYTPLQIGLMLLFVGVVLAFTQGAYVRKRSAQIGPRNMSLHGLAIVIPGLALVGLAQSQALLYTGLFFMAIGSAQVIPCMTALVSLYAPANEQGRVLGVFRSLGALARAAGPILACLLYWRLGSGNTYYAAAALVLVPLIVAAGLPKPNADASE
jgi:MFS family permease